MFANTDLPTRLEVIVVVGEFPEFDAVERRRVAAAVSDAAVLVVAPATAVAGERWIVDREARERQAQARLDRWCAELAPIAAVVVGEVGDADQRLAVADARRACPAAAVVTTGNVAVVGAKTRRASMMPRLIAPSRARSRAGAVTA